uniref:Secreted protein n=1 Tax=Phytophthora fragariae TaxID=53985 RepID=A0A6A3D7S3_9STRA|nr:hypothetical protein PF009_g33461 [Phytophthora fragariae]
MTFVFILPAYLWLTHGDALARSFLIRVRRWAPDGRHALQQRTIHNCFTSGLRIPQARCIELRCGICLQDDD